MELAKAEAT
jgi:hypothetical protein